MNEYGAWIFWRFLTESDGAHGPDPTIIRRVWELAADGPGDPNLFSARAVQQALDARDRSLAGALATFGVWNLAPAAFYEEGSAYPRAPVSRQHRVSARHPIAGWSTIELNHLATGSVSFAPGAGDVGGHVAPAGAGRAGAAHRLGRARPDPHAVGLPAHGDGVARRRRRRRPPRAVLGRAGEPRRPGLREREHELPLLDGRGLLVQRAVARGRDAVPLPGGARPLTARRCAQSSSALGGNGSAIGS